MTDRKSSLGVYEGYSEEKYDGMQRFSQYVSVRDGTKIALDYYRPTQNGKLHQEPLPVIWTQMRYLRSNLAGGTLNTIIDFLPWLATVLRHGYVIGIADVRGSGASYGSKFGWYPEEEAQDAYDIVEWFAEQPWSNGKVGMYGYSYLAITQYFAASQAPPHLRALIPAMA